MKYIINRDKVIALIADLSNHLEEDKLNFDYLDGYNSAIRDAVNLILSLKC